MLPHTLHSAPLSPIPCPLPSPLCLRWRSPAGSEPAPYGFRHRPDAINPRSSAFICGLVSAEAPSNDRCAYLLFSNLPIFDVFATFAFSAVSRSTPQSTPRAQSIHKKTEMTKMTTKVPPVSGEIKVHSRITILHQQGEYFHIPIQEYNNKLT